MEKKEKLSFLSPLSFNLTSNRLSNKMEGKQRRKSVCSPISNSSSVILGLENFSINDRRNDTTMFRPLTESSVLPRPQWYEELVQRRMREEPMSFEARFGHKSPSVQRNTNPAVEINVPQPSPDIMMLLDSNYTPQRIVKSGRRASVCIESPDVFSFNPSFLIPNTTDSVKNLSVNNSKLTESLSPRKSSVLSKKEKSSTKESKALSRVNSGDSDEMQPTDFIIPELPEGQDMLIELKSNWGDEDFIGLNGIEVFEVKTTNIAKIDKVICESDPNCDVSVLFDGVHRTHDNSHIWLTAYNPLNPIKIRVKFSERLTLLVIRIWNYNKSRIYSDRGVKQVEITLDNKLVFRGEIAKAFGELNGPPERFGDTILFTTNDELLESLGKHDKCFKELLTESI